MKIGDFESYKENPSKPDGVETRDIRKEEGDILETTTGEGEVIYSRVLGRARTVKNDTLPYKKVYNQAIPSIGNFTTAGLKVWCYILQNLEMKKDEIFLSLEDCKQYTGYTSDMAIYKGLLDLLDKQFLFRKTGSTTVFFINVNMFFNGKRI